MLNQVNEDIKYAAVYLLDSIDIEFVYRRDVLLLYNQM